MQKDWNLAIWGENVRNKRGYAKLHEPNQVLDYIYMAKDRYKSKQINLRIFFFLTLISAVFV